MYAALVLAASLWSRLSESQQTQPPASVKLLLSQPTGRRSFWALERQLPDVEQLAIERLQSDDPIVLASTAAALGVYGPAAAEEPLWETMKKWHSRWDGKAEELAEDRNKEETKLGTSLIEAIATGTAWTTGPDRLAQLHFLMRDQRSVP